MSTALSLEGVRFGRLVALRRVGTCPGGSAMWRSACDCGAETSTSAASLRAGITRSCGCLRREACVLFVKASRRAVVSYSGAHQRTVSTRGKASKQTCPCGAPAEQWAYNHSDPDERSAVGRGAYSLDPQHYVAMCGPCHAQLDAAHRIGVLACL